MTQTTSPDSLTDAYIVKTKDEAEIIAVVWGLEERDAQRAIIKLRADDALFDSRVREQGGCCYEQATVADCLAFAMVTQKRIHAAMSMGSSVDREGRTRLVRDFEYALKIYSAVTGLSNEAAYVDVLSATNAA